MRTLTRGAIYPARLDGAPIRKGMTMAGPELDRLRDDREVAAWRFAMANLRLAGTLLMVGDADEEVTEDDCRAERDRLLSGLCQAEAAYRAATPARPDAPRPPTPKRATPYPRSNPLGNDRTGNRT